MSNQSIPPMTEEDNLLFRHLLYRIRKHQIALSGEYIDLLSVSKYLYDLVTTNERLENVTKKNFDGILKHIDSFMPPGCTCQADPTSIPASEKPQYQQDQLEIYQNLMGVFYLITRRVATCTSKIDLVRQIGHLLSYGQIQKCLPIIGYNIKTSSMSG